MNQPIEEKVAALEIKVELMERQLAQHEQAFMQIHVAVVAMQHFLQAVSEAEDLAAVRQAALDVLAQLKSNES